MSASAASSRRGSRRNSAAVAPQQEGQTSRRGTASSGVQQLGQTMEQVKITDNHRQLHPRSPPGRNGTKVNVLTNHFRLTSFSGHNIYQWTVNITRGTRAGPDAMGRVRRRVLVLLLQQPQFAKAFTDYEQTLVTFSELDASKVYTVDYMESEESQPRTADRQVLFTVTLTSAAPPLPTQPLQNIIRNPGPLLPRAREYEDVLNMILLRFAGQHSQYTTAARGTKVFSLTATPPRRKLGFGLDAYRGYIRRIHNLQGGLFMLANVSYSVMYEENWVDLVIEKWKPSQPSHNNNHKMAMLHQFLQKVKVKGMFGSQRVKPIASIAHTNGAFANADTVNFFCETHPTTGEKFERQISVLDWFKAAYPGLKFRHYPRIVLNVGSGGRNIWWPANLCKIEPGQPYKSCVPHPEQTKEMITFACKKPNDNINFIKGEGLTMLGIRKSTDQPQVSDPDALPFRLSMEMATAPARRIPSPTLQFLNGKVDSVKAASGQWNLMNRKFKKAGSPVKYTILVLRREDDRPIENLDQVANTLSTEIARLLNLGTRPQATKLPAAHSTQVYPVNNEVSNLTKMFSDLKRSFGIGYCFVISSIKGWYPAIKTASDSIGMHTSLTLRQHGTQARGSPGEIDNVLMKFNMKLGGVNWCLDISKCKALRGKTTMFMGADVVHPPPGSKKNAPSAAALVASISPTPAQFPGTIALQHHPDGSKKSVEMILTLDTMLETRLELWQKMNGGILPQQIFYLRDGVSEGQLQQVLDQEVPLIEKACLKMYKNAAKPLPKLFVQTTQKRHNARLYRPANDSSGAFDTDGNPLPGLWVDQMIVSNAIDSCYAVHHKGLQGTVVPVQHTRIYDEIGLGVDEYQELTHSLAFLSERSVTSTSLPAPVMYAHLLCERAKHRLHDVYFPGPGGSEQVYRVSEATFLGQQSVAKDYRDSMYFI